MTIRMGYLTGCAIFVPALVLAVAMLAGIWIVAQSPGFSTHPATGA